MLKNIDYEYSLEPPRRGGSNEYPQSMFWTVIWKNIWNLIWKLSFFVIEYSVYLNRRFVVMSDYKITSDLFCLDTSASHNQTCSKRSTETLRSCVVHVFDVITVNSHNKGKLIHCQGRVYATLSLYLLSENGVYSKREEFPSLGSKFFPLRVDLFSNEA